jgi:hypothetical protein
VGPAESYYHVPTSSSRHPPSSSAAAAPAPSSSSSAAPPLSPPHHPHRGYARALEESFIVLPLEGSLLLPRGAAGVTSSSTGGLPSDPGSAAAAAARHYRTLGAIFELAATGTHVDQPLCLECAKALHKELSQQLQDAEAECRAYREAAAELLHAPSASSSLSYTGGGPPTPSQQQNAAYNYFAPPTPLSVSAPGRGAGQQQPPGSPLGGSAPGVAATLSRGGAAASTSAAAAPPEEETGTAAGGSALATPGPPGGGRGSSSCPSLTAAAGGAEGTEETGAADGESEYLRQLQEELAQLEVRRGADMITVFFPHFPLSLEERRRGASLP